MKKTWLISYSTKPDRNGNVVWHTWKNVSLSRQNAEIALKQAIDQDRNNYNWALFESVLAFEVKRELIAVEIEDNNVIPLEAVPAPVQEGGGNPFDPFEDDEDIDLGDDNF